MQLLIAHYLLLIWLSEVVVIVPIPCRLIISRTRDLLLKTNVQDRLCIYQELESRERRSDL